MDAHSVPDPRRLRYVASHFSQLRGFRQVACGVFLLLVFGAMEMDNNWTAGLLAILFVGLGLAFWRLGKYYERRFGRVETLRPTLTSFNLRAVLLRFAFVAAFLLVVTFLRHSPHSVNFFVSWVGAFIFLGFFGLWGYPAHYLVLSAPYVLIAVLQPAHPNWLGTAEVWSIPALLIIAGLLDHRLLVRSLPGLPDPHHD